MGQLTQTTAQVQVILDDADAANVGKTSLTDSTDTTAVAVRKSGFYSLGASSSNAPSTDRAILISAVRDTTATGEIRYGQVAITESNGMWWNRDDGGTLGTWYEAVSTAGTQTLTNKTLTSPVLTTPQINDTSANHQYVFAVSELVADRTVTLPLLTGNDTFVFEAHTQTLTNKTLTSPVLNTSVSGSAVLDEDDMSSNSATQLATQQSIKAYVDSQVTAQDLDFAGGSGTGSVDLDSQTFTIAGTANEIETAASSQTLTIGLPDSVTITTALSVDTVNEKTTAAGVTVDSLLIKDGGITAAGTSTFAGQTISDLGTVTTANIDGGSIDGTTIGASTAAAITGTTGQFNTSLNVDGTVTADGLTVDTDTLVVDATNNRVGIGTSSPAELLVLDKSSGDTFVRFDKSGTFKGLVGISDSAGSGSGSAVAGDVILRSQTRVLLDTGGTTRAVVDASGRVGIGTSSPQFDLQTVNGGLDSRGTGSGIAIRNNVYFDSSDKYLTASGAASTQYFDGSGNIIFYNTGTASTGAGNAVSLSERMRIDSSGNVGIGNSNPSYKLSLVDTTQVGTTIQLFRTGSAAGSMFINGGLAFGADGGNGDTQRMVISSSTGNVGIGTSSPAYPLSVQRSGVGVAASFTDGVTDTTHIEIVSGGGGSLWAGGFLTFGAGGGGSNTERMRIDSSGNVGIGTSSPASILHAVGSTGIILGAASGNTWQTAAIKPIDEGASYKGTLAFYTHPSAGSAGSPTERMRIDASGNVSVTPSAGLVENAVGVFMLPTGELRVKDNTEDGTSQISIYNNNVTNDTEQFFVAMNLGDVEMGNRRTGYLSFKTNNAERMRIDASGNLLVGKTATGGNTAGMQIIAGSFFSHVRDGGVVQILNRKTSDGDILQFEKDNTTVGSIGVNSSRPYLVNNVDGGIHLSTDGYGRALLLPADENGAPEDNLHHLGSASHRWRDLYLAGGVYLGGTGSANLLDDYEEGTFTPTVVGSTTAGTASYTTQYGSYTKTGNVVNIHCVVNFNSHTGTGNIRIAGLPFNSESTHARILTMGVSDFTFANTSIYAYTVAGTSNLQIATYSSNVTTSSVPMDSEAILEITGTYTVA